MAGTRGDRVSPTVHEIRRRSADVADDRPERAGRPVESSLAAAVFARAASRPDATAIRQDEVRVSYAELCGAAAQLAGALIAAGAGPEDRVAVCARRTPELLVAVLGILSAGCAYVPLVPTDPPLRRAAILEDSGARFAVVDDVGREMLHDKDIHFMTAPSPIGHPAGPLSPGRAAHPDQAAYVLFTSGSTGPPKGVVVSHRSVLNYASDVARGRIEETSVVIGFAALGFDASVIDIYGSLLSGAALALLGDEDRLDPARIQDFLRRHRTTCGYLPPALLALLDPHALPELSTILVGGDTCPPEQVQRWSGPGRRLLNVYGPTETTVTVTAADLRGEWERPVPIGSATGGHRLYVLDEDLREVADGASGQLHIAGPGLARGYLGRPGATAAVYLPDPFGPDPGARMYATGDLVRRIGAELYFLGRIDRQVKISGQRVELGEIEAAVRTHPRIHNAAVTVIENDSGTTELVAFLTPEDAPDRDQLRSYLTDRLPAAMRPVRVLISTELPMLSGAKVDLAELRRRASVQAAEPGRSDPARSDPGRSDPARSDPARSDPARCDPARSDPARSDRGRSDPDRSDPDPAGAGADRITAAISAAWTAALGGSPERDSQDFFAAGGHSLAAMRLVSRLRATLGRDISVAEVFTARTPAGLRTVLAEAGAVPEEAPGTGNPAVIGPAQRRLWFLDRLTGGTAAYNIALAIRLRGALDVIALTAALAEVARRHEVLRWRLPAADGAPTVEVAAPGPVPLPVQHGSAGGNADTDKDIDDWLGSQASEHFDLAAGPLWRAALRQVDGAGRDHVLAITVHHAIFDGWSVRPLYATLSQAYSRSLVAPSGVGADPDDSTGSGYADYVAWVQRRHQRHGRRQRNWWTDRLRDVPAVLDLPRDRSRPAVQSFRGASVRAQLPPGLAERVAGAAQDLGATVQTVLLTAFGILVARQAGLSEVIVGIPAADRRHPDFDDVVGFFVDTIPIPLRLVDPAGFREHVAAAARTVADVLEHRDAPYEDIVDSLRLPRDLSRNPLVQVLFNAFDVDGDRPDLPGVDSEVLDPGLPGSLFDLTLYVEGSGPGLRLHTVYNPDLYDSARIVALLDSYVALLDRMLDDPSAPVGSISARPPRNTLPAVGDALPPSMPAPGLVEAISDMAAADPDRTAVSSTEAVQTFGELAASARALSEVLAERRAPTFDDDVRTGAVAILTGRALALPAQLLGVLASGQRWLVLDDDLPGGWSAELCAAAGVHTLVCARGATVPAQLADLPRIETPIPLSTNGSAARQWCPVPPAGRGYLMATSGTTGRPGIVDTPEQPLAAFLDWYAEEFGIGAPDVTALLAGLGHDPMLRDVFAALRVGGRVSIPGSELIRDPDRMVEWLTAQGVTIAHLTPQLVRLLSAAGAAVPGVRLLVLAGDQLLGSDVGLARRTFPNALLVNGYGSTETPQLQALQVLDRPDRPDVDTSRPVRIGRGRPGVQLQVLLPDGTPAAVGELGRILIRSRYLASGYRPVAGDPGDTLSRNGFAPNRGMSEDDRMFSTGDLGRYDTDGAVVVTGRHDDVVKVRGRRVSPDEVRTALADHPSVAEAEVVARGTGDDVSLVGYVVLTGTQSTEGARAHLEARLPDYARPAVLVALPAMPLTANGKLDRAALPPPRRAASTVAVASPPRTATERLIAGIWRDILGLASVGVRDNFFDIGGHSLGIIAVQARLAATLDREVKVVDLFRFPNIEGLAAHLDGAAQAPGLDRAARRLATRRARRSPGPAARSTATPPAPPASADHSTEDPR